MSKSESIRLEEDLEKFAAEELNINMHKSDGSSNHLIKQKLNRYFFGDPQEGTTKDTNTRIKIE